MPDGSGPASAGGGADVSRHQPRPVRYIDERRVGDWRLKVYGIALPGQEPRPALVANTVALAATALPAEALEAGRSGVGFVIAHDARGVCFGLVYWWQGDNELHQRLFFSAENDPEALIPIEHPAAGCVWELGVIDFERRAWLADVLANPAGPDVALYMSRRLSTEF